jgi:PBSX family phage portal protein
MPDDLRESAATMHEVREGLLKATVIAAREKTHVVPYQDEQDSRFEGVGAIIPPYDPTTLLLLLEHSNALRQCIDAYVTNIDAFGHTFEPIIDVAAADADDRLASYIVARRIARMPETVADPAKQVPQPTVEELAAAKLELAERMRAERMKVQHFFDFACLDYSFVTLRRRTRQDLELLGNAYWEVLRNDGGQVAGFEYVPSFTVRHMKADTHATCVSIKVKENEFDYGEIKSKRYFRRFVQIFETRVVWFKEFGDPRFISATTGAVFNTREDWDRYCREHNGADVLATEMIHFRVHTPKSSYGVPRWIGTILSVLGSRQAEEVNLTYFENKSVPPLAILVQGGRMSNESIDRVKDFIENEIKGKKNFHKILVLEAEGQAGGGGFDQGRMKIDLKPLTAAQHNDALFQNYDERNIDKVGQAFRLPRMLRGDIRDFNRATAEAALQFAESQVFGPERDEFDFTINRKILPVLGIRFWRFKSHTVSATNPQDLTAMIEKLSVVGVLTPAEGRELAEKVFNRELRKINESWVRQPLELTKAGIVPPEDKDISDAAAAALTPGAPTGGTPLGGAAMSTPTAPAGGGVVLTGTDAASVITVNEARQSMGLGPLQKPADKGGGADPDGFLTVAEFKALRMSLGQTQGAAEGQEAAGATPVENADMTTGDLASEGGLAIGGQRRRFRRQPPTTKSEILSLAADLMTLRKTMSELEVAEIERQFTEALRQQKAAEDPENGGPIEG